MAHFDRIDFEVMRKGHRNYLKKNSKQNLYKFDLFASKKRQEMRDQHKQCRQLASERSDCSLCALQGEKWRDLWFTHSLIYDVFFKE